MGISFLSYSFMAYVGNNNTFLKMEWCETLGLYVRWSWMKANFDCQSNTYEILFLPYATETFSFSSYAYFLLNYLGCMSSN